MNIKRAFATSIEQTGNPLAPIILHEAYGNVDRLARLMAPIAGKKEVTDYQLRLMASFTDEELGKIASTPNFIMALCGLLATSLVDYGRKLAKGA